MDKNTCCPICVKEFFKVSNLRRHTKKFHPDSFVPLPKKHFAFTCEVCGKNFSCIRNYRCHLKLHDPNPPQSKVLKNCPLCDFISEKKELYEHYQKIHAIELVTEEINFQSFEQFMMWKMSLENDTKTNFIRGYAQQTKYYDEVILFVCHRSGHHFPKSKNIRKSKSDVVTKKIGGFCPASIKMMKKYDGNIKVSFLRNHVGHNDENTLQNREPGKLKIILSRHKNSLSLPIDSIVKCDDVWKFHSEKNEEVYVISSNETECNYDCPFACKACKACLHKFSCSCKDWTIKWNMCVHIHLLCRILNEEQEKQTLRQQHPPNQSNSNLDITDLIIYDGGHNEQTSAIIQEIQEVPATISIEQKNVILHEFSNLLIKCNNPSLFQEIVTIVGELKTRIECEEILSPVSQNQFSTH